MPQKHLLQLLQSNISHEKSGVDFKVADIIENSKKLNPVQKKEAALFLVKKGENLLFKENLLSFELFEAASKIFDLGPDVYCSVGLAFLSFGQAKRKEKALLLAQKNFKKALEFAPNDFFFLWKLSATYSEIGSLRNDGNLLLEAKNSFAKAQDMIIGASDKYPEFHWDFARLWTAIAESSGEACDLRMAIQSFNLAQEKELKPDKCFWNDFGTACLKLALLVNDDSIYLQAISHFKKALEIDSALSETQIAIANAYKELYFGSFNPRYFHEADQAFSKSAELSPDEWEVWLDWAELLGEEGRLKKDAKKLKGAIEKCVRAQNLNSKQPIAIGQWVESLALLGALQNHLEYINEAENKIVSAIETHDDIPELWHSFGVCMFAYAEYYEDPVYDDMAIEKFQAGLSINRMNGKLWHAMGQAHLRLAKFCDDQDLYEKAEKFFRKAISLKPKDPSLIFDLAQTLFCLGDKNQNIELLKQASQIFETLLSSQKETLLNQPAWLFCHAKCLASLGSLCDDNEEAYYLQSIETFYNVLLIDPDFPQIHYCLGLYFAAVGNLKGETKYFNRALSYFQSAIKQDEENDLAYLEWGLTLTALALLSTDESANQLFHSAEEKLHMAGQLGNQEACYNIACLYSLTKRLDEAMQFLEKSKELGVLPPMSEMLEDDWLDNLHTHPKFSEFIAELEKQV